jgi:death-on-curing protein
MPTGLESPEIKLFHRMLIDEHGGLHGIRDEGALEATLARPQHLLHYVPETPLSELAASYGFGLAKNHAFLDGNKRIALAVINTFLQVNGVTLTASELEATHFIVELAAGNLTEKELAAWIGKNSAPFDLDAELLGT